MNRLLMLIAVCFVYSLLTACGGGGDDDQYPEDIHAPAEKINDPSGPPKMNIQPVSCAASACI